MSVRVIARIRPLLKSENEIDTIVRTSGADEKSRPNVVKVPNPKNFSEEFSFHFNSVYGEDATQQEIFDAEGELRVRSKVANGIDKTAQLHLPLSTCSLATMSLSSPTDQLGLERHIPCAVANRLPIAV